MGVGAPLGRPRASLTDRASEKIDRYFGVNRIRPAKSLLGRVAAHGTDAHIGNIVFFIQLARFPIYVGAKPNPAAGDFLRFSIVPVIFQPFDDDPVNSSPLE